MAKWHAGIKFSDGEVVEDWVTYNSKRDAHDAAIQLRSDYHTGGDLLDSFDDPDDDPELEVWKD